MSGDFDNYMVDIKNDNSESAEFANPIEIPEELKVELTKEQKALYENTKEVIALLRFSIPSNETKLLAVSLKELLDKENQKVTQKEFGIMFAALLLLTAGSRELAPEEIHTDCVPFKYSDVSYVACVLKKSKKFAVENLESMLSKAYNFLSKKMNIPIAKDLPVLKRKERKRSVSPPVITEGMSRVQISAISLKQGGSGKPRFIQLQRVQGEDPTARKRTKTVITMREPTRQDISNRVVSDFKKKVKDQMDKSEHKNIYKFIHDNIDKDMEEIEGLLKNVQIKDEAKLIKKNIKVAKSNVEKEIIERLSAMNL